MRDTAFLQLYFQLLDVQGRGSVEQEQYFERLKSWTQHHNPSHELTLLRINFADLLESITYLLCEDEDVTLENFAKIFRTKGVARKFFRILAEEESRCQLEDLMTFILQTSRVISIDTNTLEKIHNAFISNFGRDKTEIDFDDFKKIIQCKDDFFVKRVFQIFDYDKNGRVSIAEFCEIVNEFSIEDDQSKISFLFHIYDINEDGKLYKENFVEVIKAAMKESGIRLEEAQVTVLYLNCTVLYSTVYSTVLCTV